MDFFQRSDYQPSFFKTKKFYEIMNHFNLAHISYPDDIPSCNKIELIWNYINNPNMYLIVIESLCLGIIITDQMANSFGYIRSIREYGKFEKYNKYQIQIVRISNKWDTSKFNNLKLKHFYNMEPYITNKSINYIKEEEEWIKSKIDINFLEALSWSPLFIEE